MYYPEYNKVYFKKRRDNDPEFKERTNRIAKEWWDRNKDKMNEKRRLKYQSSPELRAKRNAAVKACYRRKREEELKKKLQTGLRKGEIIPRKRKNRYDWKSI
jgi:hypothetical protein